ncbi:MAG: hypothetical protein IJ051_00950, partial [Clostridia bacterium]|nr:hypothetical protein [Clostridia bacterium]
AWNVGRNEAVGSREAGGRLFTSPEHCGTHARRASIRTAACQAAPTAGCEGGYHRGSFASVFGSRGKSPIRRFYKFGFFKLKEEKLLSHSGKEFLFGRLDEVFPCDQSRFKRFFMIDVVAQ